MNKVRSVCIILIIIGTPLYLPAQDLQHRPLQKLIDCPSAGGPETKSYDFELRAYPNGGLLLGFTVGLIPRFSFGVSYGGTDVIDFGVPDWNAQPGVSAAYRLIDETRALPGLAVGFTNQGYGKWDNEKSRYQYLSKGFYGVIGKNFLVPPLGQMGYHAGANFNPSETDDTGFDFFFAVDYHMTAQLALILEYSGSLNDKKGSKAFGEGRGYFNAGLRWAFGERLALDFHLRDILVNQGRDIRPKRQVGREIRISYVESL